jgi:hypothetical protein
VDEEVAVDVLIERCAGIDIGKDEVVACVRTPDPGGKGRRKQTARSPRSPALWKRWRTGSASRA